MSVQLLTRVVIAATVGALAAQTIGTAGQADLGDAGRIDQVLATATRGMDAPTDTSPATAPATADAPLVLDGLTGPITLRLPATGKGVHTSTGTTVYAGSNLAVQTLTEGARALLVLPDDKAPTTYRFDLGLPDGHRLEADASGIVDVMADVDGVALPVASFNAPWAKDATGRRLPTSYTIDGSSLIQSVITDARTVYPVVADPDVRLGSWGRIFIKFNRGETSEVSDAVFVGLAAFVGSFCGNIPNAGIAGRVVKGGCAAAAATIFYLVRDTFVQAKAQGRCAEIAWTTLSVIPVGWEVVNC